MKVLNKFFVSVLLLIVGLVISYICFNHIYAWLGVLIGVITVIGVVYYIVKQISKLN